MVILDSQAKIMIMENPHYSAEAELCFVAFLYFEDKTRN